MIREVDPGSRVTHVGHSLVSPRLHLLRLLGFYTLEFVRETPVPKSDRKTLAFQENDYGRRIYLDLKDPRARDLAKSRGNLNPGSLKLFQLCFESHNWDYVVDVGANYGEMLAGLEGLERCRRAFAFEPNGRLAPFLRRTFSDFAGKVQVRQVALGRRNSFGLFLENRSWSGTSRMISTTRDLVNYLLRRRWAGFSLRLVKQRTLDNQLGSAIGKSILVKIDVEGLEFDVLRGARRVMDDATDFGLVLEVIHLRLAEISRLFELGHVYLLELATEHLVEITDPKALWAVVQGGDSPFYRQDVFVSSLKSA